MACRRAEYGTYFGRPCRRLDDVRILLDFEPIGPLEFEPAPGGKPGLRFNDMGTVISTYESLKKSAVEPYIAARDAYVKYRRAGISGQLIPMVMCH